MLYVFLTSIKGSVIQKFYYYSVGRRVFNDAVLSA